jgi:uncharacterized FlgJ-related protein
MKKSSFKALYSHGLVYIHILLWLTIFIYLNFSATLKEPAFQYNNNREFIVELQRCIDYHNQFIPKNQRIPDEMIIAQAIVESDYGTSRFAIEANNLFGIRTFNKEEKQLKPLRKPYANFGVKVFKTKCDSVRYYITMMNNHSAYQSFRALRDSGVKEPLILITKLYNFSENKMYYYLLKEIIINLRKDNNDSKNTKA